MSGEMYDHMGHFWSIYGAEFKWTEKYLMNFKSFQKWTLQRTKMPYLTKKGVLPYQICRVENDFPGFYTRKSGFDHFW